MFVELPDQQLAREDLVGATNGKTQLGMPLLQLNLQPHLPCNWAVPQPNRSDHPNVDSMVILEFANIIFAKFEMSVVEPEFTVREAVSPCTWYSHQPPVSLRS